MTTTNELAAALENLLIAAGSNWDEPQVWDDAREALTRYRAAEAEGALPVTGEWYESVGGVKRGDGVEEEIEWMFNASPTTRYGLGLTNREGEIYTRASFRKRCEQLSITLKEQQ